MTPGSVGEGSQGESAVLCGLGMSTVGRQQQGQFSLMENPGGGVSETCQAGCGNGGRVCWALVLIDSASPMLPVAAQLLRAKIPSAQGQCWARLCSPWGMVLGLGFTPPPAATHAA